MYRKGMISVVLMILAIIAMVFLSGISSKHLGGFEAVSEVTIQSKIYAMDHSLTAAKEYLSTSLDYSYYQACYDLLKKGGIKEPPNGEYDIWFNSEDGNINPPSEEEFFQELEAQTLTYINKYIEQPYSFLTDYQVVLPEIVEVLIAPGSGSEMELLADTSQDLYVYKTLESGEKVEVGRSALTVKTLDDSCYLVYQEGVSIRNVLESNLFDWVKLEVDSWPSEGSKDFPYKDSQSECEGHLEGLLGESINQKFSDYGFSDEDFAASVEPETEVKLNYDCSTTAQGKECNYDYSAKTNLKVTVQDRNRKVPVWNGQAKSFEPYKLVFSAFQAYSTKA